jgi:hypothetical protein
MLNGHTLRQPEVGQDPDALRVIAWSRCC